MELLQNDQLLPKEVRQRPYYITAHEVRVPPGIHPFSRCHQTSIVRSFFYKNV